MAPSRRNWKKINRLKINEDAFILQNKLESHIPSKDDDVDRISQLPDDILESIISLLTYREAINTTKILSTRWRRLDPIGHTIISLNFPFPVQRIKGRVNGYVQIGDAANFSNHINRMKRWLEYSYNYNEVIKLLRMDIPSPSANMMKLVEFAVLMETETLDIRMLYDSDIHQHEILEPLLLSHEELVSYRPGLKSIKDLSLSGVAIYVKDDISSMLKNLVALERLSIDSPQLMNYNYISVCGYPACKLKHLLLSNITSNDYCIEVRDVASLVSLKCDGLGVHALYLDNLPNLAHLGAAFINAAAHCSRKFRYCHHSRGIYYNSKTQDKVFSYNAVQLYTHLPRLKHLELDVVMGKGSTTVQQLFPIINAFPSMEKLEIKFTRLCEPVYNEQRVQRINKYNNKLMMMTRQRRRSNSYHLKTIVISDFSGSVFELEFAVFVMHNVVDLKELIVEACVTDCPLQRKEMARSSQLLISVTPSFLDLILK